MLILTMIACLIQDRYVKTYDTTDYEDTADTATENPYD